MMKDPQIELNRVWPGWTIIEQLGKGAYGEVYRIERCEFSNVYTSALKVIEIPYSQEEVISARTRGMSEKDVTACFYNMVESIVKDLALMSKLCGICNIVSYQDYAVTKKEDEIGWIIFIRMEFLTNLSEIMMIEPLRGADAIQIGMDICRALEVCEQNHIIHRDIKPENIFRSKQGDYKLGDIGIIRHLEKTMSDIPTKEPVSYMAPEVYYRQPYNGTADIYSLGLTMYRLLIPQLLPDEIDKCVYLDSDIIVNLDINELWCIELGDKPLAVITEISNGVNSGNWFDLCIEGFVDAENYFNSGIMLMNLKFLRGVKEQIREGIRFRGEHPNYRFFDQAVWNYCFSSQTLKLPTVFNRFVRYARIENESVTKKIYHYTVNSIYLNSTDVFNRLWMSYFIKTPFFDAETIGRLYESVQNLHTTLKQSMINISAIMSGKTRTFFVATDSADAIKKVFSIRKDESIILAESEQSLKKLIDAMKKAKGKKVFFIVLPNFPFNLLIQEGFVPGKDFVNGFEFLSEAQGLPLNSYPFVQAM